LWGLFGSGPQIQEAPCANFYPVRKRPTSAFIDKSSGISAEHV